MASLYFETRLNPGTASTISRSGASITRYNSPQYVVYKFKFSHGGSYGTYSANDFSCSDWVSGCEYDNGVIVRYNDALYISRTSKNTSTPSVSVEWGKFKLSNSVKNYSPITVEYTRFDTISNGNVGKLSVEENGNITTVDVTSDFTLGIDAGGIGWRNANLALWVHKSTNGLIWYNDSFEVTSAPSTCSLCENSGVVYYDEQLYVLRPVEPAMMAISDLNISGLVSVYIQNPEYSNGTNVHLKTITNGSSTRSFEHSVNFSYEYKNSSGSTLTSYKALTYNEVNMGSYVTYQDIANGSYPCDVTYNSDIGAFVFKPLAKTMYFATPSASLCDDVFPGLGYSTTSNTFVTVQAFGVDDITNGEYFTQYLGKVTENDVEKDRFKVRFYASAKPSVQWNGATVDPNYVGSVSGSTYYEAIITSLPVTDGGHNYGHSCVATVGSGSGSVSDGRSFVDLVEGGYNIGQTLPGFYSGVYDGSAHLDFSTPDNAYYYSGAAYDSDSITKETPNVIYLLDDGSWIDNGSSCSTVTNASSVGRVYGFNGTIGFSYASFYAAGTVTVSPCPITIHDITLS